MATGTSIKFKEMTPTNAVQTCASQETRLLPVLPVSPLLVPVRNYAKGKGKPGKGKKAKNINVSDEEMEELINVDKMRDQFDGAVSNLRDEYIQNLTIRTSLGSIESLEVEFEGDMYPLQEVAQVIRKSPQMLQINAATFPSATTSIVQALQHSGMNLNPQQEGTTIYVPIPKVTKDHRENLSKNAKVLYNKCRDHLRDVANRYVRKVKAKEGQASDDLIHDVELKIREIMEDHVKEAEQMMTSKQKELLNVK